MSPRSISTQLVVDLVRSDTRFAIAFADLGISPRYLNWTVASAAADAGANLDRLAARLTALKERSGAETS